MPVMPPPIVQPVPAGTPGDVQPKITPVTPQVADPTYDGVAVDTSWVPRSSLIAYMEGSSWTTEYYRQVIGGSNELAPQDTARPGAYQQYQHIRGLVIKVSQPLQTNQDDTTKNMLLSGSGLTPPGMIPNAGDEFIADVGDGRHGIFTITSSSKKSFLKDTVYAVEYALKDYATPQLVDDLNAKVIVDSTYVSGNLVVGDNPIIATTAAQALQQLRKVLYKLMSQYFASFFSAEFQTLIVPDQAVSTYDTFLTHAVLRYVTTDESPVVSKIRLWNVDGEPAFKSQTLWNAIDVMRADILPMVIQQVGLVDTCKVLNSWPYFQSAYFSRIGQLVIPTDIRTDVDAQYIGASYPVVESLSIGRPVQPSLSRLLGVTSLDGLPVVSSTVTTAPTLPDILPVTIDPYYVFSRGFYQAVPVPASKLEQFALLAMQGQTLNPVAVLALANNAPVWPNLERYYYVPVLIALIKTIIGNP